jgi:integrase
LHRQTTRHGKTVWYVRIGKGSRVRIRSAFGTPEFDAEYQAALSSTPRREKGPVQGTLAWLITRYQETSAWKGLSQATRRQRDNIFEHVLKSAGDQPFAKITTATIMAARDRRASTPAQARHVLDTMRGLFRWAALANLVKVDPTLGVANPPQEQGDGFPPWTEDDVATYEARWPIGTRQRVWLDVLIYTGLRRGDAVRLGKQHVRNGVATLKTAKTDTEVTLPILPALAETLTAGPCGDLAFIAGEKGGPLTKESFGNLFKKACRAAGVPGSAHGLRKIAATRAANNGATVAQLEAIFGWQGGRMAALYTRAADRRRLATEGMHMLENNRARSIASPQGQVRTGEPKE